MAIPAAVEDNSAAGSMPHVLMVSFAGQGHLNPLLRLGKRIAAKGLLVTFSSSHDMGHRIAASTSTSLDLLALPTPVGRGFIRFEFFDDGIDVDEPRRKDLDFLMPAVREAGRPALAELIRRQAEAGRPVSCVVNNPFIPWSLDVAAEMGIPGAVLWVQSAAVFTIYYCYHHALAEFPTAENPDAAVNLPGLPPLTREDLPSFLLWTSPYQVLKKAILEQFENISKATWVFANSFEELERDPIAAISHRVPIIPVGPLVDSEDEGVRGDIFKAAEDCMEWLDERPQRSVVYASLGSVVVLEAEEMAELAWGLAGCGQPFLWVVRSDVRELLPEGFEEAAGERGKVVEWSPQSRVLAHPALACFVTHCGWNSTQEVLTAGVPVVAYPQFGDQMPDAKLLVEECGIGVRLQQPAAREEVKRCVEAVTRGEGAEGIRKRAAKWRAAATEAVGKGGSSDNHVQAFVDEIKKRAGGGGGGGAGAGDVTA